MNPSGLLDDESDAPANGSPIRQLPRLVAASWRLVRSTSPRDFVVSAVLQVAVGLASGGVLLAGREAVGAVLAADDGAGGLSGVLPGLLAAAAFGLIIKVGTSLQAERSKALGLAVTEGARRQVLGVMAAVELDAFDDPAFYDRFERAEIGAEVTRRSPPVVATGRSW